VALDPVFGKLPEVIINEAHVGIGFRPFIVGRNKKLLIEVGVGINSKARIQ
jgi:hypothetical protein